MLRFEDVIQSIRSIMSGNKFREDQQQIPLDLAGGLPSVSGLATKSEKISVSRKALAVGTKLLVAGTAGISGSIGYGLSEFARTKAENKAAIAIGQITELDDEVSDLCNAAAKMRKRRE